jgi:hypothetical protein
MWMHRNSGYKQLTMNNNDITAVLMRYRTCSILLARYAFYV